MQGCGNKKIENNYFYLNENYPFKNNDFPHNKML